MSPVGNKLRPIGRGIEHLQLETEPVEFRPRYGSSPKLSLQEVLFGAGLPYETSTKTTGMWVDRFLNLEEFLIEVEYPQHNLKGIRFGYASNPEVALQVRELFAQHDRLYMRVISEEVDCEEILDGAAIPGGYYGRGLHSFPTANVRSIEMPEGELWVHES